MKIGSITVKAHKAHEERARKDPRRLRDELLLQKARNRLEYAMAQLSIAEELVRRRQRELSEAEERLGADE